MKVKVLIATLLSGCLIQSCNVINPAEKVPTYIRIDSIKVKTDDYAKTGTTNSNITSTWVYVNNALVGAFDLPATIPLVIDANSVVSFGPGINFNGLKDYQVVYSFYTFDTFSLSPAPGKVITHSGVVKYTEAAKFKWFEDFETGNKFQEVNNAKLTDTSMVRVSAPGKAFEGNAAGYVWLDKNHTTSEVINSDDISITRGDAYLEINYKCNVPFIVGLQTTKLGNIEYEYIVGAKATDTWKKMYIGLADFTGKYSGSIYHLMIKTELPEGMSEGYIAVDNMKVISY